MEFTFPEDHRPDRMWKLREEILSSPVAVALERARVYTDVFQATDGLSWIVRKAMALRKHLETVPLYLREGDQIAGSISETPGAMPVHVEIGIGENAIYVGEYPHRRGYLKGQVPDDIRDYWMDRNLWGRHRAFEREVLGRGSEWTEVAAYKLISCQGHLSPSYREVLELGLEGLLQRVLDRRQGEHMPLALEFLTAAEHCLRGLICWAERYADHIAGLAAARQDAGRRVELEQLAADCTHVAHQPPQGFRQALQLVWFCQQAIHIEGHGYSNTPDRVDQILYPYYQRDRATGAITDDEVLTLCENLLLKMRDNTVWGVEHNLTQGICLGGSTPGGEDQTNELSWMLVRATDNMSLPEPLVWIRWHPSIDQGFFDFCLRCMGGSTCFPLVMSDAAVPEMFMNLGVEREDAFDYVAAGCNEIAVPGRAYFNPGASCGYLSPIMEALESGRDPGAVDSFATLMELVRQRMEDNVLSSYRSGVHMLTTQMRWGQTPLTSCFFHGCVEQAHDMIEGTRYNIMSCGGVFLPNAVDCLAAIREVVFEKQEATLGELAEACAANFEGYEGLRAKVLAAPKHGNDEESLRPIVRQLERFRDEPLKRHCRDIRDGTPYGNSHVVRSGAVRQGRVTGATPDGRLAGRPLAGSVAASDGQENKGPTALLNSVLMLSPTRSWQCGYNVNMRLQPETLRDSASRAKVRAMLNGYLAQGGQELQINSVDPDELRDAQHCPQRHRDLVVRIAGFSEFFVQLDPDIQNELISRTEHSV